MFIAFEVKKIIGQCCMLKKIPLVISVTMVGIMLTVSRKDSDELETFFYCTISNPEKTISNGSHAR